MGGDDNGIEQESGTESKGLRDRIKERDLETPSPEVRAKFILDLIQDNCPDITNWDILCFCSEYLGSQALIYDWLEPNAVVMIARRVQTAHYLRDEIPESGVEL